MQSPEQIAANYTAAETRFFTASSGQPPTNGQKNAVAVLREHIVVLAASIEGLVPNGRNKSLALTALEDVQMRANRGIFAEEPSHFASGGVISPVGNITVNPAPGIDPADIAAFAARHPGAVIAASPLK